MFNRLTSNPNTRKYVAIPALVAILGSTAACGALKVSELKPACLQVVPSPDKADPHLIHFDLQTAYMSRPGAMEVEKTVYTFGDGTKDEVPEAGSFKASRSYEPGLHAVSATVYMDVLEGATAPVADGAAIPCPEITVTVPQ
jgi:hypothetical protein